MIGWLFGAKKSTGSTGAESREETKELPFVTDLHSHLIPGIDDGVQNLAESVELIGELWGMGYRRLVITPHVMADSYRNSTAVLLEGAQQVREALREAGIAMEIAVAAEYYMDEELLRRLATQDILTVGEDLLLFETSYYSAPLTMESMVYEISASGYIPLLAHPERYRYITDMERVYGELRRLGTRFQVNLNSLGGYYGREAREKALWLMTRGWIDFLGSDLHGKRQLTFLQATLERGLPSELFEKNSIGNDALII